MQQLSLHKSCDETNHRVFTQWMIKDNFFVIDFLVEDYKSNTCENFSRTDLSNIGLWEFDVCEVFLSRTGACPYIELQVSPLEQPFALIVEEPRLKTTAVSKIGMKWSSTVDSNTWKAQIQVSIDDIPGSSDSVIGNVFCCLGDSSAREYYALNINNEPQADFHKPELFKKLESL